MKSYNWPTRYKLILLDFLSLIMTRIFYYFMFQLLRAFTSRPYTEKWTAERKLEIKCRGGGGGGGEEVGQGFVVE